MAKNSFKGTYRLRSLYGEWYIYLAPANGGELEQKGSYEYFDAKRRCDRLKRAGWVDLDAS